MAFPTTGVLDTFDRADENPLSDGGKWTNKTDPGFGDCQVLTNLGAGVGAGGNGAFRNNQTYGPDTEAFLTISTLAGNGDDTGVEIRIADGGLTTVDAYRVVAQKAAGASNDIWRVARLDNTVQTVLGANIIQEFSAGDGLGIEMVGSTITVYWKTGGTWTSLGTRTDTTYTAAGNIGMLMDTTTPRVNDFGGGTVGIIPLVGSGTLAGAGSIMGLGLPTKSAIRGI